MVLENWTTRDEGKYKAKEEHASETQERKNLDNRISTILLNTNKSKFWSKSYISSILWRIDIKRASSLLHIQFFREFDPGSGWTLAACLTHSSRTVRHLRVRISGGRVSNAWATCLSMRDNGWKRTLIPHNVCEAHALHTKDLSMKDGLASD